MTAGNSSQTSDGAAAAIVMSEKKARELGLKPRARFVSFAVGGVPPEIMGIGPIVAIPKALKLAGLKLEDIGLVELNEAFAVQALAVAREVGLNMDTLNVNGGAIALGHPLGCTGAKLTATILREMERRKARYGMVTMCIGGGQGAAGIFESLHGVNRFESRRNEYGHHDHCDSENQRRRVSAREPRAGGNFHARRLHGRASRDREDHGRVLQ